MAGEFWRGGKYQMVLTQNRRKEWNVEITPMSQQLTDVQDALRLFVPTVL
jgi:hypothetical protein